MEFIKIFFCVSLMLLTVLSSGCSREKSVIYSEYGSDTEEINMENGEEESNYEVEANIELLSLMAPRLKALNNDETLDEAAIIIDGQTITRRIVETEKVYAEFLDQEEYAIALKQRLEKTIEDKVLDIEAGRLNIEVPKGEVDDYINHIKESFALAPEMSDYLIEGAGMTEDEYYNSLEDTTYHKARRSQLLLQYVADHEEEIQSEANRRNVSYQEVADEYKEKYKSELVKKADIIILDDEVKKLF